MLSENAQIQYRELRDTIHNMIMARLNKDQQKAVITGKGPVLCLAGAGSGKTTAMVYRMLHLLTFGPEYNIDSPAPYYLADDAIDVLVNFISTTNPKDFKLSKEILGIIGQDGIPMYRLLAITFTNKAAREMRERLEKVLGEDLRDMWVMTFHSACLRILKREAASLESYTKDFSIYDTPDSEGVIKSIIKSLNLDDQKHKPKAYLAQISKLKSQGILPRNTENYDGNNEIAEIIYTRYQQKLVASNAMDFDDLLMQTVILFKRHPEVLEKYQDKFEYIMVDEYQDTNHIQYLMASLLAKKYGNICVVGDDDQSIYSFRQADIRNILDFERDFPGSVVLRLEQNYRSTATILNAANNVIANNIDRKKKTLWTQNPQGEKVYIYHASDDQDEARFICSQIMLTREQGGNFSDHAILMRTNAQSRMLEEWFGTFQIPYRIIGGMKFYERKEIKDLLAYLKVIANPDDQVAFRRIVNVPKRGIGEATVDKFIEACNNSGVSVGEAIFDLSKISFEGRSQKSLEGFSDLIKDLKELSQSESVKMLVEDVLIKSGYKKMLEDENTMEARNRFDNILEFINKASDFDQSYGGGLSDFLGEISLITDMDMNVDNGAVQVMTMHMAKGLEFPKVFVVGMEEGTFPHFRSLYNEKDIEEERRLCYVAMTRAKVKLYMIDAARRRDYSGQYEPKQISRFLEEIPKALVEEYPDRTKPSFSGFGGGLDDRFVGRPGGYDPESGFSWGEEDYGLRLKASKKPKNTSFSFQNSSDEPKNREIFKTGDKVIHKIWGPGSVVSVAGIGDQMTYVVAFPSKGLRTLRADLAPLERLK